MLGKVEKDKLKGRQKLKDYAIVISPFERKMDVKIVDHIGHFLVPGYTLMVFEKDE